MKNWLISSQASFFSGEVASGEQANGPTSVVVVLRTGEVALLGMQKTEEA